MLRLQALQYFSAPRSSDRRAVLCKHISHEIFPSEDGTWPYLLYIVVSLFQQFTDDQNIRSGSISRDVVLRSGNLHQNEYIHNTNVECYVLPSHGVHL